MGEETNATEPIMNFAETLHDFEKISRRCRDMLYEAHEREVDALRGDTYLDAVSDSVLAKHGLVRLPVDADGVTIRVGDTLDGYGKTIEVVEMRYGRGGSVLISRDGSGYADTFAFTHHHEPTVEERLSDEEVVRCRDCACFSVDDGDHDYRSGWWCHRWNTDMVKPDGFCAWGERRDA